MFCTKCGKQIDDDSVFCPFCGQPVPNRQAVDTGMPVKKGMTNQMKWGIGIATGVVVTIAAIVGTVAIAHNTKEKKNTKQEVMADRETSKRAKEDSSSAENDNADMDTTVEAPVAKEVTREDIFEALQAYQDYFLDVQANMQGASLNCQFVHLDDDKIPECLILDDAEGSGAIPAANYIHILSYKDGNLIKYVEEFTRPEFWLNPQTGVMLIKGEYGTPDWGEMHIDGTIIRLLDTFQTETASYSEYYYTDNYNYHLMDSIAKINGQLAESEEDVTSYIDSFQCTTEIGLEKLYHYKWEDYKENIVPHSLINLYILQNATIYGACLPLIYFYEYKDDILTVKYASDWEEWEFSYPVVEDCLYGYGYENKVYKNYSPDYSPMYTFSDNIGEISFIFGEDLYALGESIAESRDRYAVGGDETYLQNVELNFYVIDGEVVEIFESMP